MGRVSGLWCRNLVYQGCPMAFDSDRLSESPVQAWTCQNCDRPQVGPRCVVCGWSPPDGPIDDDDDDSDTDVYTPGGAS